jgi:hypothetical protein
MSLLIIFTILILFINSSSCNILRQQHELHAHFCNRSDVAEVVYKSYCGTIPFGYKLQIIHVQQTAYFPFSSIYLVSTLSSLMKYALCRKEVVSMNHPAIFLCLF